MINYLKKNVLRLISSQSLEWVLLIVALLPFFLISAFNHPTDDDFHNAARGSVESFIAFQKTLYTGWTGRYTSNLLYSLVYRSSDLPSWLRLIKLAPVLWLLGIIGSTYFAMRVVLPLFNRLTALRFTLWSVLLLLYGMPLLVSALYWYCGAAVYTIGCILSLLLLGAAGRALRATNGPVRWAWSLMAAFFVFALLGCNEIYIGGIGMGLALTLIFCAPHTRPVVLLWVLVMLVGGAFSIMAPGNFVRAAQEGISGGVKFSIGRLAVTICKDIYLTHAHWAAWSSNGLLWLVTILFLPVALRIHARYSKSITGLKWFIYPNRLLLVIIMLVGFMLFMGLPTFWLSNDVPQRIWNYTYFLFLPTWFLLVQYLVSISTPWHHWLRGMPSVLVSSLRILFFLLILTSSSSAVNRAYIDLAFRAREYDRANQARYMVLQEARKSGQKIVSLPPLMEQEYQYPLTIFMHDLDLQPKNIANTGLSNYFHLDSVYLNHLPVPIVRHLREQ